MLTETLQRRLLHELKGVTCLIAAQSCYAGLYVDYSLYRSYLTKNEFKNLFAEFTRVLKKNYPEVILMLPKGHSNVDFNQATLITIRIQFDGTVSPKND